MKERHDKKSFNGLKRFNLFTFLDGERYGVKFVKTLLG